MGTPLYFSPELARGADPTPAADVWALGATLYTAVEGVPPIADRRNAIATLAAIAETRPPHPEHGAFLTDPIGRMLDPDPASRWSMADAAHALRRLHERHRPPGTLAMTGEVGPAPPAAPVATDTADVRRRRPAQQGRRYGARARPPLPAAAARRSGAPAAPDRDHRRRAPGPGRARPVLEHRLGTDTVPRDVGVAEPLRDHLPLAVPDRVIVVDHETADGCQGRGADAWPTTTPCCPGTPGGPADAG